MLIHHHRDFPMRKLIEGEIVRKPIEGEIVSKPIEGEMVRKLVRESEVKSRRSGVDCFSLGIDCCCTKVRKSKRGFVVQ